MWASAALGDGAEVAIRAVLAPPALAKEAVQALQHEAKSVARVLAGLGCEEAAEVQP
jgi:hypothetical protein